MESPPLLTFDLRNNARAPLEITSRLRGVRLFGVVFSELSKHLGTEFSTAQLMQAAQQLIDISKAEYVGIPYKEVAERAGYYSWGRVVRSLGEDDYSRAYVVMPTHRVLEEYARRVEREMSPIARKEAQPPTTKTCPTCAAKNPTDAEACSECGTEFPPRPQSFKKCEKCGALNLIGSGECQSCGHSFRLEFEITLNEALRVGAIVRGMDLGEE
jgi:ribosomal protein L40E